MKALRGSVARFDVPKSAALFTRLAGAQGGNANTETVPWPGHTFLIKERESGKVMALLNGRLQLQENDMAGDRSSHWVCELARGWLVFRNPISGNYSKCVSGRPGLDLILPRILCHSKFLMTLDACLKALCSLSQCHIGTEPRSFGTCTYGRSRSWLTLFTLLVSLREEYSEVFFVCEQRIPQQSPYVMPMRCPKGGYLLLLKYKDLLMRACVDGDGNDIIASGEKGTVWDFVKVQ